MPGLKQRKSDHLENTLEVIGDKWTPLLLNRLMEDKLSFCECETFLDGISPRTLSQRLDHLEANKIVKKRLYCQHPPRYKYELTSKGQALHRVINAMTSWGAKYS